MPPSSGAAVELEDKQNELAIIRAVCGLDRRSQLHNK